MHGKPAPFFAAIGSILLIAAVCSAQVEQGAITGVVTDQTGSSVAKAKVTATNTGTQVPAITQTNEQGYYKIPFLPPGSYSVLAEKEAFSAERVTNIGLTVGLTATINITLKPGNVRQEITVVADAVLLDEQTSSLGNVVGTRQITQLPLSGRNPYALVTLAPGVLPGGNNGVGPIVSGGRSNTSAVLLDGAETRNTSTNDIAYTPPLEAVAEFKVITNNYSAEYGRSGGGILTVAGTTGTNQLHGSAYEFFRNNVLNANGWTNNRNGLAKNPLRHNEYGFAIGGPVEIPKVYNGRNHTFFFFNWEQVKDRSPDNITATVPTLRQRAGDFSQTGTAGGALIKIYDPATTRPDDTKPGSFTRDAFPNNQIPSNRIDPIALKLLQFIPLPNISGVVNNYVLAGTRASDSSKYFSRVDHNFGDRNRLFLRYGFTKTDANSPFTSVAFPGEGTNCQEGLAKNRPQTVALSDTETFRPNLIGEFRFSYTRQINTCVPRSVGFDITTLGLPAYLKAQSADLLFPQTDITDVTSIGAQRASHYTDAENTPEAQAHLTWQHGAHSVKGGIDYLFLGFNIFRPDYPSGNYAFSRAFTQGPDPSVAGATSGFGVATLLLGAPTGGAFTLGPSLASSQKSYNAYLQDDWKVSRKLTLNLGLRYEYETPWTERYNHLAFFDPAAIDPLTKRAGVLRFLDNSNRYQSNPQNTNFAPRFGLAYNFMKNTVFRAGYGWFFLPGSGGIGASPGDLGSGSQTSTPIFLGPPQAAPNTPVPGASLANPFVTGLVAFPNTLVGNSIGAVFPDWTSPFNQQWNANIQRTVFHDLLVEAAYIGSRGEHIWANVQQNAASAQYLSLGSQLNALVPNPFYGTIQTGSLSTPTVRQNQLLLPYPQYTGVSQIRGSIGDSVYHAFTLKVEKRMSRGLQFQAAYTFGKLIDDVPERFNGRTSIIDPHNLKLSRSISDNDRSQYFVTNFIYELPFGYGKSWLANGITGKIFGNWQVSGISTLETGQPLIVTGPNNTQLPGLSAYPLRLHNPNLPSGQQSIDRWFDTSAFSAAPLYSLGSGSRTEPNLRNPGLFNLDLGLSRSQPITERIRLQFRAELFNATNRVNFRAPSSSVTSANFGQITAAGAGRTVQLGLRLTY